MISWFNNPGTTEATAKVAASKASLVINGKAVTTIDEYNSAVTQAAKTGMFNGLPFAAPAVKQAAMAQKLILVGNEPEAAKSMAEAKFNMPLNQSLMDGTYNGDPASLNVTAIKGKAATMQPNSTLPTPSLDAQREAARTA